MVKTSFTRKLKHALPTSLHFLRLPTSCPLATSHSLLLPGPGWKESIVHIISSNAEDAWQRSSHTFGIFAFADWSRVTAPIRAPPPQAPPPPPPRSLVSSFFRPISDHFSQEPRQCQAEVFFSLCQASKAGAQFRCHRRATPAMMAFAGTG